MQVADANLEFRQQLCLDYFTLHKQLADKELSAADRADLQQQMDNILLQTQYRSITLLSNLVLLPISYICISLSES